MKKHYVLIALAGVLWGMLTLVFKALDAAGITALQAVLVRNGIAAVLLWAALALRKPSALRLKKPSHLLYFVGTGMVSLAFFSACYYTCIARAGVGVAALLLYTAPAFVMLLSAPLFQEQLTGRKLFALAMTVLGCGLVTGALTGGLSITPAALLFGLGSGFGYALYTIFGKFALRDYDSLTITAYTVLFAALGVLPFCRPGEAVAILCSSPSLLLTGAASAVLCTIVPYLAYTKGLTTVEGGRASIIASVEPVVAAVIGVVFFGEGMPLSKLLGMALVLGAILLLNLPQKSKI